MLVPEGLRLKWRGQRGVLQNLGDDLRVPKHVRTLACSLGAPCGGGETVERNGPRCTPDTCQGYQPHSASYEEGWSEGCRATSQDPQGWDNEHLSWGTALNVLFGVVVGNPQAFAQAWIETEFLLTKVEGSKVDST